MCSPVSTVGAHRKLHNVFAAHRRNQLLRRPQRNHLPMIHNRHAIAQPLRLFHVVRRQNNRAPRLLQLVHQVPQMPPRLRIEPRRRLVQKQQLRIAHQRRRHRQPLLLPAGEPAHARLPLLFQLRRAGSTPPPKCRADRSCETAAASPPPSACQETASPAVESRSAAAARRRRSSSSAPATPPCPRPARSAPRRFQWSSSSPPRSAPAGQSTRPAPTSRSSPSTACTSANAFRSPRISNGAFSTAPASFIATLIDPAYPISRSSSAPRFDSNVGCVILCVPQAKGGSPCRKFFNLFAKN